MTLILSGTDGLSDVDGTAATPALRGTDANTGIFFGTDIIGFSEGGVEAARFNASGVFTTTNDATIQGLTVGRGAGAVATNTVVGGGALQSNTTASNNTAVGYQAGYSNTTGSTLDAFGSLSLRSNTTGTDNCAFGTETMNKNTTGISNAAFGRLGLYQNTTGGSNTAVGTSALQNNTTASNNTAVGFQAGYSATTNGYNTFVGQTAGYSTTGVGNTFVGCTNASVGAGYFVTTGTKNTIIGGFHGNQGGLDIRTSSNHIVLSDGDGNPRLFINSTPLLVCPAVYNNTTGSAANVFVDSSGGMYRSTSSLKYKRDVQDTTHGLAEVLQLRPVTYKCKGENDGETVFGGLIAEEVHAAGLTEFVQYADDGTPDALAYGNMVSVLVKAIQEQQALITALTTRITALEQA